MKGKNRKTDRRKEGRNERERRKKKGMEKKKGRVIVVGQVNLNVIRSWIYGV